MKLRDSLWIWGQDAGSHHNTINGNMWNLPGENHMGPLAGCKHFGVPNCCRVVMNGKPEAPFDHETELLSELKSVVWSIIGDTGSKRNNDETDLEEVVRVANLYPNVTGAIMDDFMRPARMDIFTPDVLAKIRERLHTGVPGRSLDFWTVLYTKELTDAAIPYLEQVDKISLWTWEAKKLVHLEEYYDHLFRLIRKPTYAGCYMYDYGGCAPMPMELMRLQLDTYLKWLREGRLKGIIFCSNAIADLGLEAPDYTKDWIAQHGDEEIPG